MKKIILAALSIAVVVGAWLAFKTQLISNVRIVESKSTAQQENIAPATLVSVVKTVGYNCSFNDAPGYQHYGFYADRTKIDVVDYVTNTVVWSKASNDCPRVSQSGVMVYSDKHAIYGVQVGTWKKLWSYAVDNCGIELADNHVGAVCSSSPILSADSGQPTGDAVEDYDHLVAYASGHKVVWHQGDAHNPRNFRVDGKESVLASTYPMNLNAANGHLVFYKNDTLWRGLFSLDTVPSFDDPPAAAVKINQLDFDGADKGSFEAAGTNRLIHGCPLQFAVYWLEAVTATQWVFKATTNSQLLDQIDPKSASAADKAYLASDKSFCNAAPYHAVYMEVNRSNHSVTITDAPTYLEQPDKVLSVKDSLAGGRYKCVYQYNTKTLHYYNLEGKQHLKRSIDLPRGIAPSGFKGGCLIGDSMVRFDE